MKKRIFSRLMAVVVALSMLSTSALAFNVNQAYINDLTAETDASGNSYVTLKEEDSNYILVEDIKTDYTLRFSGKDTDATLDLNGFTIDHQNKAGSVILVDEGAKLTIEDSSEKDEDGNTKGTITGGTGNKNVSYDDTTRGGGILLRGWIRPSTGEETVSSLTINGGNITDNSATSGGGILATSSTILNIHDGRISNNHAEGGCGGISSHGDFNMSGGVIQGNHTEEIVGGIGLFAYTPEAVNITGGMVTGNEAGWGGGIFLIEGYRLIDPGNTSDGINVTGAVICGNSSTNEAEVKAFLEEMEGDLVQFTTIYGDGEHDFHAEGESEITAEPTYDAPGERTYYCAGCHKVLRTEEIPQLQRPTEEEPGEEPGETPPAADIDFGDGTGTGTDTGTTIADEATPLAGILTLADLLNALYEHEGIEAVELPEDFQWADHVYAQAIHWGLSENLVVDTEDDPLDPDELLTVALLREVLVNFVEYKGIDFTVTLDGEDEDLVLDLGERLTAFYPELEKVLAKEAA